MQLSGLVVGLLLAARVMLADTVRFDLEGLSDSTPLTNQFPGFLFSDATTISSGISSDEFEFPPHSGANVIFDGSGTISIAFSFVQPVVSFSGFFTYTTPQTLDAWHYPEPASFFLLLTSRAVLPGVRVVSNRR